MNTDWTFGRKMGAGFVTIVVLTVITGSVAIAALRRTATSQQQVFHINTKLLQEADRMESAIWQKVAASRAYFIGADPRYLEEVRQARGEFVAAIEALRGTVITDEGRKLLDRLERQETEHQAAMEKLLEARKERKDVDATLEQAFASELTPRLAALRSTAVAFVEREKKLLDTAITTTMTEVSRAILVISVAVTVSVIFAIVIALILSRSLTRDIGASVAHAQSSSAELQAAANQQAAGAREQATALTEISTTIRELLMTSKQIAESAQQVARLADETARTARAGDGTVQRAKTSLTAIRQQVDVIVDHMLELGKRSHQIGSVIDIVSELAEQTNILAINATIEAAGAGEAGKRFAVVGDEIRKLSDRVGTSAKEIRSLVEDVRTSVNSTVMATEGGSKAVDAGAREFGEVASAFTQISSQVATTTEAAREIQLSTKQQSTGVEQLDVAVSNVAVAAREAETSAGQVLESAGLVSRVSRDLARLITARGKSA